MLKKLIIVPILLLMIQSCRQRNGCTDPAANNFVEEAENDDGSCRYDNQLFNGRWRVRDTIIKDDALKAEDEKILTIISDEADQSEIKLIWKFSSGQTADTLQGKMVPLAISIPQQKFGTRLFRGNIIYMFYDKDPVKKIRLSYILSDQLGNEIELRGTGEKLP
jgi:hypothetical protein